MADFNNGYTSNGEGNNQQSGQENGQAWQSAEEQGRPENTYQGEEPRTPYQTPVQRPEYQQHSESQQDRGQRYGDPQQWQNYSISQQQESNQQSDEQQQAENAQQWQRFEERRQGGNQGEWQQFDNHQQYGQSQQPYGSQQSTYQKPPKKKRSKAVIALCGVAAACLLFAGGAVIGHVAMGDSISPNIDAQGSSQSDDESDKKDMPTVEIATKPDTLEYDSKDGMAGEDIYKKVSPSIVSVLSTSYEGVGSGSGVIMTEDGYIITNNHVVEDSDQVTVQLVDGTQMDAKIVGMDAKTDLAVLKVEPSEKLVAAEFGNSDILQPGERAYAIGSPGGVELANTITGGYISAINRDITIDDRVMTLIQTDASINPGNSGGALINKYGQVVGITSAKLSGAGFGSVSYEGLGFAIPMSTAKTVVDELISKGYIAGRPSIGITGQNISAQRAQASNLPQGVYIRSVDERAHAAQEGLLAGDIITKVDGQDITTMDEINKIKETKKAGDKLTLHLYRMSSGKMMDITITLTDEHDLEDDSTQQNTQQQQIPQQGDDGYSQYFEDPFSYFFGW